MQAGATRMDHACRGGRELQGLRRLREVAARLASLGVGAGAERHSRWWSRRAQGRVGTGEVGGGRRTWTVIRLKELGRPSKLCGIWLEGDAPSDATGTFGRKKRQRGASPSVRNRSARGHRYTPNKASNPMSRDVAADACGKLTTRQAQGRR